jgi:hypothetical protein
MLPCSQSGLASARVTSPVVPRAAVGDDAAKAIRAAQATTSVEDGRSSRIRLIGPSNVTSPSLTGFGVLAPRRGFFRAPPAGLEPATRCLEGSCSVRLSYGGRARRLALTPRGRAPKRRRMDRGGRIRTGETSASQTQRSDQAELRPVPRKCTQGMAVGTDQFALGDLSQEPGSVVSANQVSEAIELLGSGQVVPLHRCRCQDDTAIRAGLARLQRHVPGSEVFGVQILLSLATLPISPPVGRRHIPSGRVCTRLGARVSDFGERTPQASRPRTCRTASCL